MLAGRMRHGDNKGHSGLLRPGSVQWMTAGRGIVHSEMPEQEDGLMWGFQLWVNLPPQDKMTAPRYQEFEPEQVPVAELPGGVKVRVIAGKVGNVERSGQRHRHGADLSRCRIAGGRVGELRAAARPEAFAYPFEGEAAIGDRVVPRGTLAVLGDGKRVALTATEAPRGFCWWRASRSTSRSCAMALS